ncbi:hypothetical protein Prudu_010244 [Prunus dulcis]|uniref:Uncharacterized protein n=1 Tax=Prunus dulcis TaxID=3755 RepID=A0A4Y1R849_PRUDU|nr:hypothetical protein Prudu_010244 [Prunus dulcis]
MESCEITSVIPRDTWFLKIVDDQVSYKCREELLHSGSPHSHCEEIKSKRAPICQNAIAAALLIELY